MKGIHANAPCKMKYCNIAKINVVLYWRKDWGYVSVNYKQRCFKKCVELIQIWTPQCQFIVTYKVNLSVLKSQSRSPKAHKTVHTILSLRQRVCCSIKDFINFGNSCILCFSCTHNVTLFVFHVISQRCPMEFDKEL